MILFSLKRIHTESFLWSDLSYALVKLCGCSRVALTAFCLEFGLGAASTLRWLGAFMAYLYVMRDLIFPHFSGSSGLATWLLSVST